MPNAPLIYNGNAARFLKPSLIIPGSTSGTLTISPAATTTSYALVMPAAQGAASTVLTNDGSGNLSWSPASGGGSATSFTIANNQSSAADVTGFLVSDATEKGFSAEYTIVRRGTVPAEFSSFYSNLISPNGRFTSINDYADAVAANSSGEVLIGGDFTAVNSIALNRLVKVAADGTLDSAFNTNLGTGPNNVVRAIAFQSDGKAIVVGSFTAFNSVILGTRIIRLNTDGTEDTTFTTNVNGGANSDIRSVFVLPDDSILLGGAFTTWDSNARDRFVKLNADGTEDTTFTANLFSLDNQVNTVIADSTGSIYLGGVFTSYNGNTRNRILKLNSDGTEDTTWATTSGTAFSDQVWQIDVQADDKIIVATEALLYNGTTINRFTRLNTDATIDSTFNTNVSTGTGLDFRVNSCAALDSGKSFVTGIFTDFDGTPLSGVMQFNSNGTPDTTFNTNVVGDGLQNGSFSFEGLYCAEIASNLVMVVGSFSGFNNANRKNIVVLGDVAYDYVNQGQLRGLYRDSSTSWELGLVDFIGDDTGVVFSMTNAGQLQYTSTDLGTSTESNMHFILTKV